jgi:feruloyl esterase
MSYASPRTHLIGFALASMMSATPAAAATCDALAALAFPDATVTAAQLVPAGSGTGPTAGLPEHCRVAATLRPSPDSDIKIEVWLPVTGWNTKLLAVGNGGWNGNIDAGALATGLRRGYAVTATDTGHEGGGGPWMQRPEKVVDFGHRAVHEMTVKAKTVVSSFYGKQPSHSYFQGCSAGGRQAVMAAHRYPDDFDGIVAGAPAVDTTGRATFAVWITQQQQRAEGAYIPPDKYPAIHQAALQACDLLDGVADTVIENPRACTFDPKVLECKAGDSASCLTSAQVETARAMYKPLVNPRTGATIFPGLERGTELGWSTFGGPRPFALGTQMFQFMVFGNPAWDYKTLNFDTDMAKVAALEKGNINVLDPNLDRFAARGGKLIHYHGWADQQIPAGSSTRFFQSVATRAGSGAKLDGSYRMFMVPGMGHCGGGAGTTTFDMLTALEQWTEAGKAPASIPASRVANGQTERTRPLCPFPQVATYSGAGSTNDAANFTCKAPQSVPALTGR